MMNLETIQQIVKLVEKKGITVVICGVFIWQTLTMRSDYNKAKDDYHKYAMKQTEVLLLIDKRLDKINETINEVSQQNNIELNKIHEDLKELKQEVRFKIKE